jgi:hypothetical protein
MNNVAHLHASAPAVPALGPGEVVRVDADRLEIALRSGRRVEARAALAFSYQPVEGDVVLVIGPTEDAEHYVIGVIAAKGRGVMAFAGDLEIRAVGGRLSLGGDEGIELSAPTMNVQVGKLEMAARAVTQRFSTLKQRVSELLTVHAGERHEVIDGATATNAERATLLVKDKVSINGKAIHLG